MVGTAVSVIVPCFNEEQTIGLLRERLSPALAAFARSHDVETIFVDDGSTDGTYAALGRVAPELHGRVIRHERNRGIAEAFRTGFQAARGAIVCTMDADCTFDPMDLVPMVEQLETTGADIVVGSHYHPQGCVEGVPGWRILLSRGASLLYRHLAPVKLYTYTGCLRAFRRDAALRLEFRDPGFLGVAEMLVSGLLQGQTVIERPVVLRRRVTGVSKMRTARVVRDHARYMLRLLARRFAGGSSVGS